MIVFSNMIQDELKNLSFCIISAAYHLVRESHDQCILYYIINNTVTCNISNFCRAAMVFHWLTGQYESSLWELLHEYYMNDPKCSLCFFASLQMGSLVFQKWQEQKLDRKSASHLQIWHSGRFLGVSVFFLSCIEVTLSALFFLITKLENLSGKSWWIWLDTI